MDVPLQTTSFDAISSSGLAIDSSSDLSYSPGPSHTSTRNTSPDCVSTDASFGQSSPVISLSVASTVIEYESNTPPDRSIIMDKSSFQSVNDRRNKLVGERTPATQYPHVQQQQLTSPQLQLLRPNIQGPLGHHRSLTSANWRSPTSEDVIVPQHRMMYGPFDTVATVNLLQPPSVVTTPIPTARRDQHQYFQHAATSSTSCPSLGPLYDAQLDSSFAYCYDRGNGQYTRLIPADMLPPLQHIPALQHGYAGMVVVPQPRGLPPNGQWSNTEPIVLVRSPPTTPPSPADTIQSRIDNIVATTPSTTNHGSPGSSNNAITGHRRPKIYCDKWVHEGVCAFTQQGCKYKHEMPSDKLTQHQLGLFHGYPQWWKKHQADLSRQRDAPSSEAPKSSSQSSESKGVNEGYLIHPVGSTTGGGNVGCGNLTPDIGGQLAWRQNGEYSSDPQILATTSSNARTTTRGMSGAMRNAMTANTPDRNLSPCPISYGSPFGPIAPPARSNATVFIRTDGRRGAPAGQTSMASRSMPHDTRRNSPIGNVNATSTALATSNPYASLEALDDSNDQNPNESVSYTKPPHGNRLS
ncbi:hypothetical protein F5Y08DRAFT_354096 [Xylaria arbuscula]|nr:hypothetical protein F5Y08DRAFT_354096 [Xylaria arbuscula]